MQKLKLNIHIFTVNLGAEVPHLTHELIDEMVKNRLRFNQRLWVQIQTKKYNIISLEEFYYSLRFHPTPG